jgi:predicted dehydrogenase
MIKVGVCGFGYWGPTLVRVFSANPGFRVMAIADNRPAAQAAARAFSPAIAIYSNAEDLIDSPEIDVVAIAAPVSTHYSLTLRALQRGKHVLVEKPMCTTAEEGRELVAVAERMKRILMVDHTYVFHPAVRKIKDLKTSGALGAITYFDSLRVNLGLFQPDLNVLWDLAPHDFSIMSYILGEQPVYVEATGYCHINPHLPDIVYITLHYASRIIAHLNLSWMSPVKARRVAIGGTKQMVIWNDLDPDEKLKIYDSGIEFRSEEERSVFTPGYRIGDIYSPRLPGGEALVGMVEHLHRGITGQEKILVDGRAGLQVVELLEQTQRALDSSLDKIAHLHISEATVGQSR